MKYYILLGFSLLAIIFIIVYATTVKLTGHSWVFRSTGECRHTEITLYYNKLYNWYSERKIGSDSILKTRYRFDDDSPKYIIFLRDKILKEIYCYRFQKLNMDVIPEGYDGFDSRVLDCRLNYSDENGVNYLQGLSIDLNGNIKCYEKLKL